MRIVAMRGRILGATNLRRACRALVRYIRSVPRVRCALHRTALDHTEQAAMVCASEQPAAGMLRYVR